MAAGPVGNMGQMATLMMMMMMMMMMMIAVSEHASEMGGFSPPSSV